MREAEIEAMAEVRSDKEEFQRLLEERLAVLTHPKFENPANTPLQLADYAGMVFLLLVSALMMVWGWY